MSKRILEENEFHDCRDCGRKLGPGDQAYVNPKGAFGQLITREGKTGYCHDGPVGEGKALPPGDWDLLDYQLTQAGEGAKAPEPQDEVMDDLRDEMMEYLQKVNYNFKYQQDLIEQLAEQVAILARKVNE